MARIQYQNTAQPNIDGGSIYAQGANLIANSVRGLGNGLAEHQKYKDEREALQFQRDQEAADAYVARNVAAQKDREGMDNIFQTLNNDPTAMRASANAFLTADAIRSSRANQAQTYANEGLIKANTGLVNANTQGQLINNAHTTYLNNRTVQEHEALDRASKDQFGKGWIDQQASTEVNEFAPKVYEGDSKAIDYTARTNFRNAMLSGKQFEYLQHLKDTNDAYTLYLHYKDGDINEATLRNLGVIPEELLEAYSDSIARGANKVEDTYTTASMGSTGESMLLRDNQRVAGNTDGSVRNTGTGIEIANKANSIAGEAPVNGLVVQAMQNSNVIPVQDQQAFDPNSLVQTPTAVGKAGNAPTATAVDANGNPVNVAVSPEQLEAQKAEANTQRILQNLVSGQEEESIAPNVNDIIRQSVMANDSTAQAEQGRLAQEAQRVKQAEDQRIAQNAPKEVVDKANEGLDENGNMMLNPSNPKSVRVDPEGNFLPTDNTRINKVLETLNKANTQPLSPRERADLRSNAESLSKEEWEEYGLSEDFIRSAGNGGTPKIVGNVDVTGAFSKNTKAAETIDRYGLRDVFKYTDPNTPLTEENIAKMVGNAIYDQGGAKSEDNWFFNSVLKAASEDFPELRHKYTKDTHNEIASKIAKKIYNDIVNDGFSKATDGLKGITNKDPNTISNPNEQGGLVNGTVPEQSRELTTQEKAMKQAEASTELTKDIANTVVNGDVNRDTVKDISYKVVAVTGEFSSALEQKKDDLSVELQRLGYPKVENLTKQELLDKYSSKDPENEDFKEGGKHYKNISRGWDMVKSEFDIPQSLIPYLLEESVGDNGINLESLRNNARKLQSDLGTRGHTYRYIESQINSLTAQIELLKGAASNYTKLANSKTYDHGNAQQKAVWRSNVIKQNELLLDLLHNANIIVNGSYGASSQ